MPTFLLTWNPALWHWADLAEVSQKTADGIPYSSGWSTGNTKKIARGDRVFLLKQGEEPRGIIAAGWVTSEEVYEAPHYDQQRAAQGDTALRADVEFERILNPAEIIPLWGRARCRLVESHARMAIGSRLRPHLAANGLHKKHGKIGAISFSRKFFFQNVMNQTLAFHASGSDNANLNQLREVTEPCTPRL